jgi:hypothetical protein
MKNTSSSRHESKKSAAIKLIIMNFKYHLILHEKSHGYTRDTHGSLAGGREMKTKIDSFFRIEEE